MKLRPALLFTAFVPILCGSPLWAQTNVNDPSLRPNIPLNEKAKPLNETAKPLNEDQSGVPINKAIDDANAPIPQSSPPPNFQEQQAQEQQAQEQQAQEQSNRDSLSPETDPMNQQLIPPPDSSIFQDSTQPPDKTLPHPMPPRAVPPIISLPSSSSSSSERSPDEQHIQGFKSPNSVPQPPPIDSQSDTPQPMPLNGH